MEIEENRNREFYSEAYVRQLIEDYDIFGSTFDKLRDRMNHCASMYWHLRANPTPGLKPGEIAGHLKIVGRLATQLKSRLAELPADVWMEIDRAVSLQDVKSFTEEAVFEDFDSDGHMQICTSEITRHEPNLFIPDEMNINSLIADLDGLVNTIGCAGSAQNCKPGPRPDPVLVFWGERLRDIWCFKLQRDLTVDFLKGGVPASPAARFCVEITEHLDLSIPSTRVERLLKQRKKMDRWMFRRLNYSQT